MVERRRDSFWFTVSGSFVNDGLDPSEKQQGERISGRKLLASRHPGSRETGELGARVPLPRHIPREQSLASRTSLSMRFWGNILDLHY